MEWVKLLSKRRIGQDWQKKSNTDRSEYQIDYDRLIFSTAFRRLQDKTQVFPLSKSDYVRTRLTHSLEVSSLSRSLGKMVGKVICERNNLKDFEADDFATIMAAAALAHDIGNPPFGHSGEDAIRNWFNTSEIAKKYNLKNKEKCDIENFEGNAQGFRLINVLQMPENFGGMRLTSATLGAFTKYPIESKLIKTEPNICYKKFNFYQSEIEIFKKVAENLGLEKVKFKNVWSRHPLAFLIEACDDISNLIIDYEDGYKLGLIDFKAIECNFSEIIKNQSLNYLNQLKDEKSKVEYLRAKALGTLLDQIKQIFLDSEKDFLDGKFNSEIIKKVPSAQVLGRLKEEEIGKVYSATGVIEIEAAGFEVANGILEYFGKAILDNIKNKEKMSPHSKKLLQLLPKQFHPDSNESDYSNLQKVLDFFAGMTDGYAVSLYKKIKGISLPND